MDPRDLIRADHADRGVAGEEDRGLRADRIDPLRFGETILEQSCREPDEAHVGRGGDGVSERMHRATLTVLGCGALDP